MILARLYREPALAVALFGVSAALLGFLREQAIAYQLGISLATDAVYTALMAVPFLPALISSGAATIVAPYYNRATKGSGAIAGKETLSHILWTCLTLGFLCLPLILSASGIAYAMLDEERNLDKLRLTLELALFLAMAAPAFAYNTGAIAALNTLGRFGYAGLSSVAPALAATLIVWTAPASPWSVIAGLLFGTYLQMGILLYVLRGEGVFLTRPKALKELVPFCKDMLHAMSAGLAFGLSALLVQSMVAASGAFGMSTYNFSTKCTAAYLGLSGLFFGTLLSPLLAAQAAGLPYSLRRLKAYLALSVVGAGIATLLLTQYSEIVIRIFLHRGAFSEDAVLAVAELQAIAALQIPAFMISFIASRILAARHDNRFIALCSWAQFALTAALAMLLRTSYGIKGILFSVAVGYAAVGVVLWVRYLTLNQRATSQRSAQ